MTRKNMSAEEKAKYRREKQAEAEAYKAKMIEGVANLCRSDSYRAYLDVMARFPSYSVHNLILIMMQKPGASLVQGFAAWKKMGRYVRKGEKGIRIWAPSIYKRPVEEDSAEEERVLAGFRLVSVFDVSQTDGDDMPDPCSELKGDVRNYAQLRAALVSHYGVSVSSAGSDALGGANGCCYANEGRIVLRDGMDQTQELKTLIHELAHFILHGGDGAKLPTDTKELQAESVAYAVCQHIGVDTGEYTFGYIATWGEEKTAKEIMEALKPVGKTAAQIMEVIDRGMKAEKAA